MCILGFHDSELTMAIFGTALDSSLDDQQVSLTMAAATLQPFTMSGSLHERDRDDVSEALLCRPA